MSLAVAAPDGRGEMLARVLPFALYIAALVVAPALREVLPRGWDDRWLYAFQIVAVMLALAYFARAYDELGPPALGGRAALEAIGVGVAVFALWIILDSPWAMLGEPGAGYDPRRTGGDIDWRLAAVRLFGAAAVVPIMEELFWRSFLLRWIDRPNFPRLAPASASVRALVISAVLFGVEHTQWLAGGIAGLAYGGLYMRSGTLWSPILAHAATNLLLGLWVLATGAWHFW